MGVLSSYLSGPVLNRLSDSAHTNLKKLEDHMLTIAGKTEKTFEDCIKEFGPDIQSLIDRVDGLMSKEFGFCQWCSRFYVVYNISLEIYQIVERVSGCVIDPQLDSEQKQAAKIDFGKNLVYFVWRAVDPLRNFKFPFKKTLERIAVRWLTGMAFRSAGKIFGSETQLSSFNVVPSGIVRALP